MATLISIPSRVHSIDYAKQATNGFEEDPEDDTSPINFYMLLESTEKNSHFSWPKKGCIALDSFFQEGKKRPLQTIAGVGLSLALLSAIYPNVVGSMACLKTLIIVPLSDMNSTDLATAMVASQGIGNVGMAVTYFIQLQEFVFHPISQIFNQAYNQKIYEKTAAAYSKAFQENQQYMTDEEKGFFIQKETAYSIQNQINIDLERRLSKWNMIYLTTHQIGKDVKNSSWDEVLFKCVKTTMVVGALGISSYILAVGTYGCYKPFALQNPSELNSLNQTQVENATANYANAGHGLEYLAFIAILSFKAMRSTLGSQYDTAVRRQIKEVYKPHLEDLSQSEGVRKLLSYNMEHELSEYL